MTLATEAWWNCRGSRGEMRHSMLKFRCPEHGHVGNLRSTLSVDVESRSFSNRPDLYHT